MYFTDTKLIQNHVWNAQNIPASDRISVFDMKCKVFGVFGESALKARSWLLPDTEKESSAIDQHKMSTSFTYDCIVSLCRAQCTLFCSHSCDGTYFFNIMSNPTLLEHNIHASGLSWWQRLNKAHTVPLEFEYDSKCKSFGRTMHLVSTTPAKLFKVQTATDKYYHFQEFKPLIKASD